MPNRAPGPTVTLTTLDGISSFPSGRGNVDAFGLSESCFWDRDRHIPHSLFRPFHAVPIETLRLEPLARFLSSSNSSSTGEQPRRFQLLPENTISKLRIQKFVDDMHPGWQSD